MAVLSGCGPSEDELRRTRLDEVAEATFATTLAFTLALEAPTAGDTDASGVLAQASLAGVIEGDRFAAGLTLAGLDLAQVRVTGPGEQFLRIDLGGLAALAPGGSEGFEADLATQLDAADLAPAARDAVLAATRGDWVRLDTAAQTGESVGRSVGAALEAVLRSGSVVDAVGRLDRDGPFDGQLTLDIDPALATAAVAEALAGLAGDAVPTLTPDADQTQLRARVVVDDGIARTITIDLPDGSASATDAAFSEVVLDLRALPTDDTLVRAPAVAAVVTVAQLQAAVDALAALTGAPPEGATP